MRVCETRRGPQLQHAGTCARVLLILTLNAAGLAQQLSFRHYGAAEGLQNLAMLSLAQDGAGYLWAGSEGGLYRYDGTRFRLMGAADGLPCTTEVHALHVSTDGALWANTCSKLFRFDGERFHAAIGVAEMMNRAQSMADAPDGHLIVSTSSGLMKLLPNGTDGAFTARLYLAMPRPGGHRTRGIFQYGNQLWFGCESHLCMETDGHVVEYGPENGLPDDSWDAIGVTRDGTVWVRSPSKLYRRSPDTRQFFREPIAIASSMYWGALTIAPNGELLVPTDKGVAISQGGRWSNVDESRGLPSSMVSAVLRDREGLLWIAMVGAGVARSLGDGEWEGWTKAQGLASNLVWNILRDKSGARWVATSAGLTRLEGQRPARTWTRKDGLGGDNVRWLGETSDGAVWAITRPGSVARLDPSTGKIRLVGKDDGLAAGSQHRGLIDRDGRLWVAANAGVFRNENPRSSFRFVKVNPPGSLAKGAWSVSQDKLGAIWVTGPGGLWKVKEGRWRQYGKADGLLSDNPYVIVVAPDNSLWLRHRFDAGVERVEFQDDRVLRATAIVPADAASTDVTAFHGFDAFGNFWRGTAKGVSVLHDGSWTEYSTEDGLIWDDCDGEAFWPDSDGSVWIGTSGGLAHFRPKQGKTLEPTADPILSSLEVRKWPRLVRVSFSSLNYQYEQVMHFGYSLDDGPWSEALERSVTIAGVSPGWHNLGIRCQVRNGPFSKKFAVAEFYVDPLWWEASWFRGSVVLLAALLIYGSVLWRHRTLRDRNAALERAVLSRTAELQAERARVIEEKRRADAASEAKGQFLANMSHEIRTPLSGLLGLAGLLDGIWDPVESQETIRLIQSSGKMLLGVINDILDFSKVEAGKLELDIAPFDLRSALEQAVGLFRAAAADKNLRLDLTLAPDLPTWVAGDEIRLRQVLQNLTSNALKFTKSGEIVVSAIVQAEEETGYLVRLQVRDTGIGIPPDRIEHLFSSFSQVDSSISRRYGGTGLGLAISKRLVELMGGTISIESQPGLGSTFGFTVPLHQAIAPEPLPIDNLASHDLSKLRALLVEDNKVNQIVGLKLLKELGILADLADDGAQAVEAAVQNAYDLILMDVQMPDMDGITATREIRARLAGKPQPFICGLSAHVTAEYQERCHRSGMDAYLTKPLDFAKLQRLLVSQFTQTAV